NSIKRAFVKIHRAAAKSSIRNLFMFNYTYYAKGFCKDQDCSDTAVQAQTAAALSKMGDDFEKYKMNIDAYAKSISTLQSKLPSGDLATLSGERTYRQILDSGIFVSCVDFAKSIMGKAIDLGFPKD